jgi:hypothetical protein
VKAALEQLEAIYARLNGDVSVLHASRANLLLTVELYPDAGALGFDLDEHKELCRAWCSRTDDLSRGLPTKGFGFGGLQRERAYHDSLRDLATPAMGHPPVVRIAAMDAGGRAAYERHRASLVRLLS